MAPHLTIIVPSDTVRSTSRKRIQEVTSGKERLDVIARCFLNAVRAVKRTNYNGKFILYLSHIKEQKALIIPIKEDFTLHNELESTSFIIDCFNSKIDEVELVKISFEQLVANEVENAMLFYLHPEGLDISNLGKLISKTDSLVFIIGSQKDLTAEQEKVLYKLGCTKISLGKKNYLTSHVIAILFHFI